MRVATRPHVPAASGVCIALLSLLLLLGSCSSDDATTNPVQGYPAIEGRWAGRATVASGGWHAHEFTATFSRRDGELSATFDDVCWRNGAHTTCYAVGTVSQTGAIALQETCVVAVNWDGAGRGLCRYIAAVSAAGDSIHGNRNSGEAYFAIGRAK